MIHYLSASSAKSVGEIAALMADTSCWVGRGDPPSSESCPQRAASRMGLKLVGEAGRCGQLSLGGGGMGRLGRPARPPRIKGVTGPATSGKLGLLTTKQPKGRRSTSEPYSTTSIRSSASFTTRSRTSRKGIPAASSPKCGRGPTPSRSARAAAKRAPDMITCPGPGCSR